MPKYFFDIRTPDTFLVDELGLRLSNLDAVRTEARQGARDIMAEDLRAGRVIDHQSFEVRDEHGSIVLAFAFRDMLTLPTP